MKTWLAIVMGCAVLMMALPARADGPLRVVVRVTNDAERELLARIAGQVADLDVTVEPDETPLEPTFTAELVKADDIAARRHVRVVVWFLPHSDDSSAWLLCISEPILGRVLVRSVGHKANALDSAALEETALVIRNALRALAAGGTIGVERSAYEPHPPPPEPVVIAVKPKPRVDVAAVGGVGAQIDVDATSTNESVATWLGLRWRRWELRLDGALGIPTDTPTPYATFHITRAAIMLGAGANLFREARWEIDVGARAGSLIYMRTTRDAVMVAPTLRSVEGAALVGLELRCRFRPTAATWGFVVAAGVDLVAGAPTFGYTQSSVFVPAYTPAVLEPHLLVGFEFSSHAL